MGNSLCIKTRYDDRDNNGVSQNYKNNEPSNKSFGTDTESHELEDYEKQKKSEQQTICKPTLQYITSELKHSDQKIDVYNLDVDEQKSCNEKSTGG